MHNFAVVIVQGIVVAWTLPTFSNHLICNYDVHYIYDEELYYPSSKVLIVRNGDSRWRDV